MSLSHILNYQLVRRKLRMDNDLDPEAAAEEHSLLPGLTRLIVATTNVWDRNRNLDAFRAETEAIYDDDGYSDVARALAAEHRSSCDEGEARLEWGRNALSLSAGLGSVDAELLYYKVWFGEIDACGRDYAPEEVRKGLDFYNKVGAHDAPGRAHWWVSQLDLDSDDGRSEAIRTFCAVVAAHAEDSGSMNEWYLQNKCRKPLAGLLTA